MAEIFNERPHENEKRRALSYISQLLEEARSDKKNRSEDIINLEEVQRLLNSKKYGLVWERHNEIVEEEMKTKIPIFIEDDSKKINDNLESENFNFILEGDNLHSLHLLEKTHASKIDVIYIDPPYNTGSKSEDSNGSFIYNDSIVDGNDTFKHSKWLSFMSNRLEIAKRLLSSNGVIFISIGKEENSQLKILCDEIFGESNCLGQIVRRAKTTSFRGKYFALRVDYILCYSTGETPVAKFMDLVDQSKYKKIEKEGVRKGELYKDDTAFYLSTLETRPNQRYFIKCPDGELVVPPGNTIPEKKNDGEKCIPDKNDGVWRWEVSQYLSKKDFLVFKKSKRSPLITSEGKQAKWNVYTKSYYLDKKEDGNIPTELILDKINRSGTSELKKLGINFTFPKPVALIKYLIQITNKSSDLTVLDFFAGSGTTGQAVIELNAEDSGNRKFILATNNENNIAEEVTYERMKLVSSGTEKYEANPLNLKYFKTDFIEKTDEGLEFALLSNIKALVELTHGVDLSNSDIAIIIKRKELEKLDLSGLTTIYMRSQTHKMLDRAQLALLKGIKIIDIPEKFFPKEMREVGL